MAQPESWEKFQVDTLKFKVTVSSFPLIFKVAGVFRPVSRFRSVCFSIFHFYTTRKCLLRLPFLSLSESRVLYWKLVVGIPRTWGLFYSPWKPMEISSAITPIGQLHQSPPSPIPGDLFLSWVSKT